jgi:hypothetical protein
VNAGQLAKTFQQHRVPILGVAAAGAVGLGLLHRRQAGGDTSAAQRPAAATSAGGGYSAGSQAALTTGGGVYDSTANDLYSAFQPQLEHIIRNTTPTTPTPPVPVPAQAKIASTLLGPSGSGKYVRDPRGMVAEVQSDGSLLALTNKQWTALNKQLGGRVEMTTLRAQLGSAGLGVHDTERNLRRMNTPAPVPVPAPTETPTPVPAK